jgi:molybdopterin molybdotransferase
MPEFFNVLPPDEARRLMLRHLVTRLPAETLPTEDALGRVTFDQVFATQPLPSFRRSTMDGYAVRAADTYGASATLPAFMTVVGEVPMGDAPSVDPGLGEAAIVHTGGMLPHSADAVVQIEHTQIASATVDHELPFEIEILRAVAVGQNVLQVGEDVERGAEILDAGHMLRPQDLGGLLALGITEVTVSRRPVVSILATGDEVIPPDEAAGPGQVRDINSYTIAAMTRKAGGTPAYGGIIEDDFDALLSAAASAMAESDMLVMTAGSSVSIRDITVKVIESLGEPGVLFHGVATRPGKPTIVGVVDGKPVLGLPGNPVSAMVQYDMFGVPAIYQLQGAANPPQQGIVWARLDRNIASESGREDYVPARIGMADDGLLATPVFGKSNLIYTLVNAHGLIKIPLNKAGLLAGEQVEVHLF